MSSIGVATMSSQFPSTGGTNRLANILAMILREFGGLVLFVVVNAYAGLKAAIVVVLAFVLIDGLRHAIQRTPVSKLWLVSNGLALVFGAIDLHAANPFMLRYEASISNLVTGIAFAIGAFGVKPMIQQIAEDRQGHEFAPDRPDLRAFFRAFTLVWAEYFLIKAGVYLWLANTLSFNQAMGLRSLIGSGSFFVMLAISYRGRAIREFCVRRGMFVPARGTEPSSLLGYKPCIGSLSTLLPSFTPASGRAALNADGGRSRREQQARS